MINKESQRRKTEGGKEEGGRQTKKETDGERESRGYTKRDRGERQKVKTGKVEHRNRKRLKMYSFRKQIATKDRRKKTTEMRSARYICAGEVSSRDPS